MDEATVGLDPASRRAILEDILRLRDEQRIARPKTPTGRRRASARQAEGAREFPLLRGAKRRSAVIPRASGLSSTPQLFDSITDASEYWRLRSHAMTDRGRAFNFQMEDRFGIRLRDLAARFARVVHKTFRPKRAWGMPGAQCTRSRACSVESTRVSHHGRTGITRHSRTQWF
jgi:hypothetical protein